MLRLLTAACLLLAGCADAPEPEPAATARGVYLGPAYDSAAAVVDHEAIPGVMDAMQMPFRVTDRSELRALRVGDKIEFALTEGAGGYRIGDIVRLPPDTPLDLADGETPRDSAAAPSGPSR